MAIRLGDALEQACFDCGSAGWPTIEKPRRAMPPLARNGALGISTVVGAAKTILEKLKRYRRNRARSPSAATGNPLAFAGMIRSGDIERLPTHQPPSCSGTWWDDVDVVEPSPGCDSTTTATARWA
jgi:hypothetical protein